MADSVREIIDNLNHAIYAGRLAADADKPYLHRELKAPLRMLLHLYMETCDEDVVPVFVLHDRDTYGDLDGGAICEVPREPDDAGITREIWAAGITLHQP